jgi:hypothetical protein
VEGFSRKFGSVVSNVLSGFDRLVFRGAIRCLSHVNGVVGYLLHNGVRFVDFGAFNENQTKRLTAASLAAAQEAGRPVRYLASSRVSKEDIARAIALEDGVKEGLICVLKSVEPCSSFDLHRDAATKTARIVSRLRKGLFLYHYWMDPQFGFMSARIQTWLPYPIQICLNGREWLARQMDAAGIGYERHDNCFPWLADSERAQGLACEQLGCDWPAALDAIARRLNPAHAEMVGETSRYYWTTYQSEWATDVTFRSPETLQALFPQFLRGAIQSFGSEHVMRYLRDRSLVGKFDGRLLSDLRRRQDGARVKHSVGQNSVKMYDKAPGLLRVETTINDPRAFQSFRAKEGDPSGEKSWRQMRRGVADLHRRTEVSQGANDRYLDALATLRTDERVGQLVEPACRRVKWNGQYARALRPWSPEDHALLAAVARGEFTINGFRNRDLRAHLHPAPATTHDAKRLSARITRQLRLLRAHHLIKKIPRTQRYLLTEKGRALTTALLQTKNITVTEVMKLAA